MSTTTHLKTIEPKVLIFDWQGTLANNSGKLFPGVAQTLDILKQNNFVLALATSMPQERIIALLEDNHLDTFFDVVQTGDMGYQKPDPGMLHAILQQISQTANECLMIGDSIADLVMANDAGMAAIAVLSGGDTESTLQMAEPIMILNDVNELVEALRGN
jgi:phosphoglycolate phosphatase